MARFGLQRYHVALGIIIAAVTLYGSALLFTDILVSPWTSAKESLAAVQTALAVSPGNCWGHVIRVILPNGVGPHNSVILVRKANSSVFYPTVLVPANAKPIVVYTSAPEGLVGAALLPWKYRTAWRLLDSAKPIRRVFYVWNATNEFYALLPCRGEGYRADELGNLTMLAAGRVGDYEVLAVEPGRLFQRVAQPLIEGYKLVFVYLNTRMRVAGFYEISVTRDLLQNLSKDALTVRLKPLRAPAKVVGLSVDYDVIRMFVPTPYIGISLDLSSGLAPLYSSSSGFFVYPLSQTNISLRLGNQTIFSEAAASPTTCDIAWPPSRNTTVYVDAQLTIRSQGPIIVSIPSRVRWFTESREAIRDEYSLFHSMQAILLRGKNARPPGAGLHLWFQADYIAIEPGMRGIVSLTAEGRGRVNVYLGGVHVCSGMGVCRGSVDYGALYQAIAEYAATGAPVPLALEVEGPGEVYVRRVSADLVWGDMPARRVDGYIFFNIVDGESLTTIGWIEAGLKAGRTESTLKLKSRVPLWGLYMEAEGEQSNITIHPWPLPWSFTPRDTRLCGTFASLIEFLGLAEPIAPRSRLVVPAVVGLPLKPIVSTHSSGGLSRGSLHSYTPVFAEASATLHGDVASINIAATPALPGCSQPVFRAEVSVSRIWDKVVVDTWTYYVG